MSEKLYASVISRSFKFFLLVVAVGTILVVTMKLMFKHVNYTNYWGITVFISFILAYLIDWIWKLMARNSAKNESNRDQTFN